MQENKSKAIGNTDIFKRFCSEMSCCMAELNKKWFDHTNLARWSRLEGSWKPGEG